MTRHLLDTDAVIDFLSGIPHSVTLLRQLTAQGNRLCTCDVVNAEVFSGLDPSERQGGWAFLETLGFFRPLPLPGGSLGNGGMTSPAGGRRLQQPTV